MKKSSTITMQWKHNLTLYLLILKRLFRLHLKLALEDRPTDYTNVIVIQV